MIPSDHEKNGPYYSGSDQSSEARGTADGTLEQLLACATDFDRAAGSSTDAEEWFRAESQSLLQWAEKTGTFLLPAEFRQLIDGFKLLEGGLEHQVFFRKLSGRVFKITKPPHFGHTWYLRDYVQNLIWCNQAFEDDFRLEGVISTENGVSLVISQPYIIGRSPTEAELEEWFQLQGCMRIGPHKWRHPHGFTVSDAHPGNLILMRDGTMAPVDLHVDKFPVEALTKIAQT
jgi:hypothetical protein